MLAQPLPTFDDGASERFPYGARSQAAVYVAELLRSAVPALSDATGTLDIVSVARRPGVLTKVAVRPRTQPVTSFVAGVGADDLSRVSSMLDGERIETVRWQRSASAYIAQALVLGEVPPIVLMPAIAHARVLLGEIDVSGIAGWRGLNTVLASALTGWRIRLEPVGATPAWRRLETAMRGRRSLFATVVGPTSRENWLRVEVLGLYAIVSKPRHSIAPGQDLTVRVTRMDADEGRIFVSERLAPNGQLPLI